MTIQFKVYTYFCLALIFASCSIQEEAVIGKYEWIGVYGVGSSIEFKEDSTFRYKWVTGLIFGETYGKWKIEGRKVILHSNEQPDSAMSEGYRIVDKSNANADVWKITVVDTEGIEVPFSNCIFKKDTTVVEVAQFDFEGHLKIPKMDADSILIKTIAFKDVRFALDPNFDTYTFELNLFEDYYRFFTQESWKYKNGKLLDPSTPRSKYAESRFYRRVKSTQKK